MKKLNENTSQRIRKTLGTLCLPLLLWIIADTANAQVKRSTAIRNTTTISKSAALEPGTVKHLDLHESVTASKEFASLQEGAYSIVKLKLAGNPTESNYYVKKIGSKLILNGDIVVHDFNDMSTQSYTRDDDKHTFGKDDLYRWPGGNVPIVLHSSVFQGNNYIKIKAALNFFNFNTGIVFKERTDEEDYIVITCGPDDGSGAAGSSRVGRQRNGSNILSLKGNFSEQTVLHELMHALGVWHEQSRQDRDNFVEIKFDNVKDDSKFNFQIEGNSTARSAYDYCSIMHYSSMAFAKDNTKPTIVCKSNGNIVPCLPCMGSQSGLSQADLAGLDEFYRGIGVSRFPSQMPFVSSKVPVEGCVGVDDVDIRNKWDVYRDVLGDCTSNVIAMGIFNATHVQFQFGEIYHSAHGIAAVYGDIYQYYAGQGGLGKFGMPMSDEREIRDADQGIGSWNKAGYTRLSQFEKGVIIWGPHKPSVFHTNEVFAAGPHPMTKETATETVKHQRATDRTRIKQNATILKREN